MSIRRGNNILASSGTNGLALFDFKWSDHTIVDPNWILSSPNSWHSGNTYKKMYNHLQTDYTNGESQSETIATYTITYMLAPDGHKIILPEHETIAQSIYTATGVAWYYVLDTTNKQFKLPRTKYAFNSGAPETVGNYIDAGLPNITGSVGAIRTSGGNGGSGALYKTKSASYSYSGYSDSGGSDKVTISIDASTSNSIYGNSTTVQPPAVSMLLYFFTDQFENGQQEAQETYALDSTVVHLTGNETIAGNKTFANNVTITNTRPQITYKSTTYHADDDVNEDTYLGLHLYTDADNKKIIEDYNYIQGSTDNPFYVKRLWNVHASPYSESDYVDLLRGYYDGSHSNLTIGTDTVTTNGIVKIISDSNTENRKIQLVDSGFTKGTTPEADRWTTIEFNDKTNSDNVTNTRLGVIESAARTDGSIDMIIRSYKNSVGENVNSQLLLKTKSDGTASCSFPNTTCCDGPIVAKNVTICDSVSINGSTVATYTLTDLPNDGKSYMALIRAQISTGATSGNAAYGNIHTDLITATISLCKIKATSAAARFAAGTCWVPVSSSRKIYLHRDTSWNGTCTLALIGYRRIGTNG